MIILGCITSLELFPSHFNLIRKHTCYMGRVYWDREGTYSSASERHVSCKVRNLLFSSRSFKITLFKALGFFFTGVSRSLPLFNGADESSGLWPLILIEKWVRIINGHTCMFDKWGRSWINCVSFWVLWLSTWVNSLLSEVAFKSIFQVFWVEMTQLLWLSDYGLGSGNVLAFPALNVTKDTLKKPISIIKTTMLLKMARKCKRIFHIQT